MFNFQSLKVNLHYAMKKLQYEIQIDAPVARAYKTMLNIETYKIWTAEFGPSSRYEGSWDEGSKILFLADDEHGKVQGMVSRIRVNNPNEFISIEHLGIVEDGIEKVEDEKSNSFSGALEEYTFIQNGNGTLLKVSIDTLTEWEKFFDDAWPRALFKLKTLAED